MYEQKKNDELYHHGVLGQKWGVRRYQNKDGSLTTAGKLRFSKVENSPRLIKKDTKEATKILRNNRRHNDTVLISVSNYADRKEKQYSKLSDKYDKAKEIGITSDMDKYDRKMQNTKQKIERSKNDIEIHRLVSEALTKQIDDIENEKVKAGKDFVVKRDYYAYPVIGGVVFGKKSTIVYKN